VIEETTFRVVEDDFSDDDEQSWLVDVVIQTSDGSDFKSFEERIDRIHERIDNEEKRTIEIWATSQSSRRNSVNATRRTGRNLQTPCRNLRS
jgi:hypothetical protein